MTPQINETPQRRTPFGDATAMERFAAAISDRYAVDVAEFNRLHDWSITELEEFWAQVWQFFGVVSSQPYTTVLEERQMPGARWFTGARLNYVDQILQHVDVLESAAIVVVREDNTRREVTWTELNDRVTAFAATLRSTGVGAGDRVVGYLTNADEAIVAFLGSAAVGAVWACCAPDYGVSAAADRFAQLEPTVLVANTAYMYGGTLRDRRDVLAELAGRLAPRLVVTVPRGGIDLTPEAPPAGPRWITWSDAVSATTGVPLRTEQVPPDHPLWVLFSSGTTGIPKGLVHGHAGVIVTHQVLLGLHQDLSSKDTLFWYTTTNWMLWNIVVSALLLGATTVAYEGSPTYPSEDRLWQIAEQERVTQLGISPGLVKIGASAGLRPGADHDLSRLTRLMVTGAPVPAWLYDWAAEAVSPDVPLISTSGGTDVVSSFVGGAPNLPVHPGEIPGPILGVAVEAYDESGRAVRDVVGELVVTLPMPSMPLAFWGDPDGQRYRLAYFDAFPDVWRHGDWVTHTARGTFMVHGRSDSTLNRNGVRLGSADLYQVVENIPGIAEALVLGVEQPDGGYRMPMFLVPQPESTVDDRTVEVIRHRLRTECSPRHVPDEFHVVPAIPHTKTGKKLEVPLKRILQGATVEDVLSPGAIDRPELVGFYVDLARRWAAETSSGVLR